MVLQIRLCWGKPVIGQNELRLLLGLKARIGISAITKLRGLKLNVLFVFLI
jgi:hypothetical protein